MSYCPGAGEDTAEAVSQRSNIPYTKVYSVLESLEERGWVEHSNGRPRNYFPRSPIDAMRSEQITMEKRFEENQDAILEELQPLYERKDIKEIPELWIVRGDINSFNKIIELLEKANKEIMLAIPTIPEELIFDYPNIVQRLFNFRYKIRDTNVHVKVLTTENMKHFLDASDLGIAEVRICGEMFGGGVVIDGHETMLFLDLVGPQGPDTAIWSEHETLTSISKIYFEHLWESATPYTPTST